MIDKNIIFLDIDGVLNCQTFFEERMEKKELRKAVKDGDISRLEYYKSQICEKRISWLSKLCEEANCHVVVSSTWRKNKTIEELQEIMDACGGTFKIIDKTPYTGYERGTEIALWLRENIKPETYGCHYFEFKKYVIIDDDSDMLYTQRNHFFQTDNYSGLTPNTCYKIKRFLC